MSYQTVKDGISALVKALGFAESKQMIDWENASANEYGNAFIIKCIQGVESGEADTIQDRVYDEQEWQIQIAFERSANIDMIEYDRMHRTKDDLIQKLDNPANWSSFVRMCRYNKWEVEETANYYVLMFDLRVVDTITY